MRNYNVSGMSCAACQARVEKAVSAVDGVDTCVVNLLTNSMGVEGSASDEDIIKAVVDAGYGAEVQKKKNILSNQGKSASEEAMLKRLITSLIILVPLMVISMGHMLISGMHTTMLMAIIEMLLTIVIMIINRKFFISGFRGLLHKAPNMDTLVALGAGAAFGYSLVALITGRIHELYFESAATILTLITIGKYLEERSKGRTTDALKGLMNLAPKKANILIQDKKVVEVPIDQVNVGDIFVVKAGDSIPVDGIVLKGNAAIDESALTGESIPVDITIDTKVSAATICKSGYIECKATRVGEDTTLSQIIQMVSDAAATKAPIAKIADKVSGVFVPIVMGIAIVTFGIWYICCGETIGFAISRAISVLVISCPCALGLATPVAIMVGNGVAARNGILFKTAVSLEECGRIQTVVLDKTGTITKGEPGVREISSASGVSIDELLTIAYSLELKSEHPLGKAIVNKAVMHDCIAYESTEYETYPGGGIKAKLNDEIYLAGNQKFVEEYVSIPEAAVEQAENYAGLGMTPIYIAKQGMYLGTIAIADVIKEDSPEAIKLLKELGTKVVMLTGDNKHTAMAIAKEVGVDEVIAGVLPDTKAMEIERLQKDSKVAMVGDGINDAPALTKADIGIAIGAGTDIAIDAADIVLMKNSLMDVASAIKVSRATLRNIHQNLFWAFFYNVIGIPLAAGVWIPIFGWTLSPMFGAAAMSLSSFCVVSNALRLNLVKLYDRKTKYSHAEEIEAKKIQAKEIDEEKEIKTMTISVKGMMCPHCEAHTKKAIEALDGVVSATADHTTATVVIETSASVDEALIKAAVEEAGYEYCGIVG